MSFCPALNSLVPLLAGFWGFALEGTSGPLLELGRGLLVGGNCNACVGHLLSTERKTEFVLVFMCKTFPQHLTSKLYCSMFGQYYNSMWGHHKAPQTLLYSSFVYFYTLALKITHGQETRISQSSCNTLATLGSAHILCHMFHIINPESKEHFFSQSPLIFALR